MTGKDSNYFCHEMICLHLSIIILISEPLVSLAPVCSTVMVGKHIIQFTCVVVILYDFFVALLPL